MNSILPKQHAHAASLRPLIRTGLKGLLGLLFVASASASDGPFHGTALHLSPNLLSLTSCPDPSGSGQYRVLVFSRGFEHVSSEVYVQWLDWDEDGPRVVKSLFVAEFGSGFQSVGEPVIVSRKNCSMRLVATHTYSLETTRFILRPAGRGKYSIRAVAAK